MFRNTKVGDRVWDFILGWGTIIDTNWDTNYPLSVKFDFENSIEYFTYKGFRSIHDKNPSLFWKEIKFEIPEKPFILKEWLIKNFKKKEFEKGKDNYVFIVNYSTDSFDRDLWEIDVRNYFEQMGSLYFEIISNKTSLSLQKELNDNSVSVKTFYDALKELGWL